MVYPNSHGTSGKDKSYSLLFTVRKSIIIHGHSINKRNFFYWGRTNYIYIHTQGLFNQSGDFFGLRKDQFYIYIYIYIYEGYSINKGNFFNWGESYYIYKVHLINKGIILTEEGPIIYIYI